MPDHDIDDGADERWLFDDGEDEGVGYCKPPKRTQFKKGKSGNPGGRPKGARGLRTDLDAELKSKHTASINKKPITGTKQRLAVKMLATRAASGDLKAAQVLIPPIIQMFGVEDRNSQRRPLSAIDRAILDELLNGGPDAGSETADSATIGDEPANEPADDAA